MARLKLRGLGWARQSGHSWDRCRVVQRKRRRCSGNLGVEDVTGQAQFQCVACGQWPDAGRRTSQDDIARLQGEVAGNIGHQINADHQCSSCVRCCPVGVVCHSPTAPVRWPGQFRQFGGMLERRQRAGAIEALATSQWLFLQTVRQLAQGQIEGDAIAGYGPGVLGPPVPLHDGRRRVRSAGRSDRPVRPGQWPVS